MLITAQTGMGMGIAFTAISPEDFEELRVIAPQPMSIANGSN
jgi:hypothetical protein